MQYDSSQWGKGKESDSNNPSTIIKFNISFIKICTGCIAINSYEGSPDYVGQSMVYVKNTEFKIFSGTYGSNIVFYWGYGY